MTVIMLICIPAIRNKQTSINYTKYLSNKARGSGVEYSPLRFSIIDENTMLTTTGISTNAVRVRVRFGLSSENRTKHWVVGMRKDGRVYRILIWNRIKYQIDFKTTSIIFEGWHFKKHQLLSNILLFEKRYFSFQSIQCLQNDNFSISNIY